MSALGGKLTLTLPKFGRNEREVRWTICEISLRPEIQGRTSSHKPSRSVRNPRDPALRRGSAVGNLPDRFRFGAYT
jgi:hypothetical protein